MDLTAVTAVSHQTIFDDWKKRGVKIFWFVHDICFIDYPQFIIDRSVVIVLTTWLHLVLKTADAILTNSYTVADNVKRWAKSQNYDDSNIAYISSHLGSDLSSKANRSELTKSVRSNYQIFQYVCVSTIEPRKRYLNLVSSFIKALNNGMEARLVIVGRAGWKADDVIDLLNSNAYAGTKIIWENNCSDERLAEIYMNSDCYVFASYDEGFGIGIVEAAQYGLPLLLRDIPIFREIAADHAIYFTEDNLANKLQEIVLNKNSLPSVKGMKIYTWLQSIESYVSQMLELIQYKYSGYVKNIHNYCNFGSINDLLWITSNTVPPMSSGVSQINSQNYMQSQVVCYPPLVRIKYLFHGKVSLKRKTRLYYREKLAKAPLVAGYSNWQVLKYDLMRRLHPSKDKRHHYRSKLQKTMGQ